MSDQPFRFSLQKLMVATALVAALVFALSRAYFLDVANDKWDETWQLLEAGGANYLEACEASRKLRDAEVGAFYRRSVANLDHIERINDIQNEWKYHHGNRTHGVPDRVRVEWDAMETFELEAMRTQLNH